jgi:spermidine/putrescine transport system ATP-binding protein
MFDGLVIDDTTVSFLEKENKFWKQKYTFSKGEKVDVLIRPEDILIKKSTGIISGKVVSSTYKGSYYITIVKTPKADFIVESTNNHEAGEKVFLDWTTTSMHLMLKEEMTNQEVEDELSKESE